MSKRLFLLSVFFTSLVLLLTTTAGAAEDPEKVAETAAPPGTDTVAEIPDPVAEVNGKPIPKALYEAYAEQRQRQMGDVNAPEARKTLTDEMVAQELLIQDAEKSDLEDDPEVAVQLEMARRNVLATAAVRDYLQANEPSQEEIDQEYKTISASMTGKEYKARHILVASEDEANALIKKLDEGADFSELATENSTDSSASSGGDLGWFTLDVMVKPFGDAAAKLETGKYTGTPVQTQFGWHIIMLDDVRDATPPSLEELRPRIMQMIQSRIINDYLQSLRENAKIETM